MSKLAEAFMTIAERGGFDPSGPSGFAKAIREGKVGLTGPLPPMPRLGRRARFRDLPGIPAADPSTAARHLFPHLFAADTRGA